MAEVLSIINNLIFFSFFVLLSLIYMEASFHGIPKLEDKVLSQNGFTYDWSQKLVHIYICLSNLDVCIKCLCCNTNLKWKFHN